MRVQQQQQRQQQRSNLPAGPVAGPERARAHRHAPTLPPAPCPRCLRSPCADPSAGPVGGPQKRGARPHAPTLPPAPWGPQSGRESSHDGCAPALASAPTAPTSPPAPWGPKSNPQSPHDGRAPALASDLSAPTTPVAPTTAVQSMWRSVCDATYVIQSTR